jgi:hypothetical protein
MRRAHGQSDYTPIKQRHLQMFLDSSTNGWRTLRDKRVDWQKPSYLVAIDCTAGSGHSDDGEVGSPIIINKHFNNTIGGEFRQLCCEEEKSEYLKLSKIPLVNCDVVHGSYQEMIFEWLKHIEWSGRFHGLLYCDPNGIKDAIDGTEVFRCLAQSDRFSRIDLLFSVSLNGYKRHSAPGVIEKTYKGERPEWLIPRLIEHLDNFANLKKANFIRSEMGGMLEFVMLSGLNTEKVRQTRRNENIVPYEEWRANAEFYLNGGIKVANGQLRMQL